MNGLIYRYVGLLTGAEKCIVCGRPPVDSDMYYRDHMGNVACGHHDVQMCFGCTAMCNPSTAINIPAYGALCSSCASKSIDPKIAVRLVDYVHNFYRKLGMSFPGHKLHLVSVSEMQELVSQGVNGTGAAVFGLAYNKSDGVYRVCLLRNLSKIAFAGTFAHEILHLWQYGKKIDAPSPICEGFCNLGEYLVLSTIEKAEAQRRMACEMFDPDPVYGEGFRSLKVLYDTQGWKKVIETMLEFRR